MNELIQQTSDNLPNPDAMNIALLKRALTEMRKHLMSSIDTTDSFIKKEGSYTEVIYLINNIIRLIEKRGGNYNFNDWETIEHGITLINSHLEDIGGSISELKINLMFSDESKEVLTEKSLLEPPINVLVSQGRRYDALEGVIFSQRGFSSLRAQDMTLKKIQKTIRESPANQSDIGRIRSDIDSLEHMYRNFDPRWEDNTKLLNDIMVADTIRDAELAQRISMFIRVRSAERRNYTATQEASPMLERHLKNLRERHPIVINTLEYGIIAITHIKRMHYEGAKGEYAKIRIEDKNGKKKDILLRTDNAVVGDLSRKYLGEFDINGKFLSTNKVFTILSIKSDKIQTKNTEPTIGQKIGQTVSSVKDKFFKMFGK